MKTTITCFSIFVFLFLFISSNAQISTSSQWTWMNGNNTTYVDATYGDVGVAAATNNPGARGESISWTDADGNLWLFGGIVYKNNTTYYLNDLWKYNSSTNLWTWVNGSNTVDNKGNYGTKGIADPANLPASRYGSVPWTDASGNFWLFGGRGKNDNAGQVFYDDLWKYDPSINQWTWVHGDSSRFVVYGEYGTKGTGSATTRPGARERSVSWTDATGNLWLLGGQGFATNAFPGFGGSINDLWKYTPGLNQWTWMNGTDKVEQPGVYGVQGTPDPNNTPGGRYSGVTWTDGNNNLWLFGGSYFYNNSTSGTFNDVWKYNTVTNQWTWVNGANTTNQPGVYGTIGVANAANRPGSRQFSNSWKDAAGNFWLFGGSDNGYQPYNDIWKYNPVTNEWTWIHGASTPSQQATYGTQGTASATNKPGARYASVLWRDAADNVWIFGGYGYTSSTQGYLNDLWKLSNNSVLPVTISSVKAYQQNRNIAVEWKVEDEKGLQHYDIEKSSNGVTFTKVGTQAVTGNNSKPVNYVWLDVNSQTGNNYYRILSTSLAGDTKYSRVVKVAIGYSRSGYSVYPNPVVNGLIQLQFINQAKGVYKVRLSNASGQSLMVHQLMHEEGSSTETIQLNSSLNKGSYTLEVIAPDKSRQSIKFIN